MQKKPLPFLVIKLHTFRYIEVLDTSFKGIHNIFIVIIVANLIRIGKAKQNQ